MLAEAILYGDPTGRLSALDALDRYLDRTPLPDAWWAADREHKLDRLSTALLFLECARDDSDLRLAKASVRALGSYRGDPAARAALLRLAAPFHRQASEVRASALFALGEFGDPTVTPILLGVLEERYQPELGARDDFYNCQRQTALTLGKLRDPAAIGPLAALAADRRPDETDDQPAWLRAACIEALGLLQAHEAVDIIRAALLRERHYPAREAAATALGQLGGDKALDALLAALSARAARRAKTPTREEPDPDDWVLRDVALALARLGSTDAIEPLVEALAAERRTITREALMFALGRIGDQRATEPLIAALREGSPSERRVAIEALGLLADERAREPLTEAFERDPDRGVRWRAELALWQLPGDSGNYVSERRARRLRHRAARASF